MSRIKSTAEIFWTLVDAISPIVYSMGFAIGGFILFLVFMGEVTDLRAIVAASTLVATSIAGLLYWSNT